MIIAVCCRGLRRGAGLMMFVAVAMLPGRTIAEPMSHVQLHDGEIVETPLGSVRGYANGGALIFKGLPFARPPVGDLRWRAPQDPEGWEGTRDATRSAGVCTQLKRTTQWSPVGSASNPESYEGSEDCLYLDVYRPKTDANNLPVLLWIHGGGWLFGGAADYDPTALVKRENIIVVVAQYRLGPMGRFSSSLLANGENDLDASGNFGTLDQIKALEWIRRNIAAFGGDHTNVTIGGQSAGAVNVYTLMLSPLTDGLFGRAVSLSGGLGIPYSAKPSDDLSNAVIDWLLQQDGTVHQVAGSFDNWQGAANYRNKLDGAAIKAYLRSKSDFLIQRATAEATRHLTGATDIPPLVPIMDGAVVPATDGFDVIATGKYHHVPVLLGSTESESTPLALMGSRVFKREYDVPSGPHTWRELLDGVLIPTPRKLALSDVLPTSADREFYASFNYEKSRMMRASQVDRVAKAIMKQSESNHVYSYLFEWKGGDDQSLADFKLIYGAAHASDLPFWFGTIDPVTRTEYSAFSFTPANRPGRRLLSNVMMDYLGAFVRSGDPNASTASLIRWPRWLPQSPQYIVFDSADVTLRLAVRSEMLSQSEVEKEVEKRGPLMRRVFDRK